VVRHHLTYDIKDSNMPVYDYTNLMSQIDNHFSNKTKKPTPSTVVLLLYDGKCKRHQLTVRIDPNCNEHYSFILPHQECAINRQHITTMVECFNALSKYSEYTEEILSTLWPHNIRFWDVLKMHF
jgi:hypothetical protein